MRDASVTDLPALLALEEQSFQGDRISRRSFRYLLGRAHARVLLEEFAGEVVGYVVVLFRRGVSLARLYSIAVGRQHRGRGVAGALVRAAEQAALEEGAVEMRLEIREDNAASHALFRGLGYRAFGTYARYYEDAATALRYHRYLSPQDRPRLRQLSYYRQSLDFTCGPAALMMAMQSQRPDLLPDRRLELQLWRESTTVFMTSGHGGCSPHGLALAAHHRGFAVSLLLGHAGPMFLDSVRSGDKRAVMELVQEDFIRQVGEADIPVWMGTVQAGELEAALARDCVPVVLISSYRLYREKVPHWVVVTGVDRRYVYITDPDVDEEFGRGETDSVNMPVPRAEFERMARYGRSGQRAVVFVGTSQPYMPGNSNP